MKLLGLNISRAAKPRVEERNIEDPRIAVSSQDFLSFFGVSTKNLPAVTIDSAMTVPGVAAAVTFLSRTLASVPIHVYAKANEGPQPGPVDLQTLLNERPNGEWTSFGWRAYSWQQTFTGGRALSWIERAGGKVVGLWPIDPAGASVSMIAGRKVYQIGSRTFPASDIIDVPFMLRRDQVSVHGPIVNGAKAIALAMAMGDYASGFFAGGGVPPLALTGPLPAGPDALKRAQGDIRKAIDAAKTGNDPVFPIPPGYELKPVGFDPAKGQMTEARRFQLEELARIWNLPLVFLQDLTHGTLSNTEQQDLHLVKHLVAQWAEAFEQELTLKLCGPGIYVEHSLDGLMRGDFKSRMEGYAIGVQNAIRSPDEIRALENLPKRGGPANELHIQGATVPLGKQPMAAPPPAPANKNEPAPKTEAA